MKKKQGIGFAEDENLQLGLGTYFIIRFYSGSGVRPRTCLVSTRQRQAPGGDSSQGGCCSNRDLEPREEASVPACRVQRSSNPSVDCCHAKEEGYGRQHEGGSRVERRRRRCFREVIAPAEGLSERKADDSRGEGTEAVHWGLIHFLARLINQDETRRY